MLEIFNEFDKEGKGYIDRNDVETISKEMGENFRKDIINHIFKNCSRNGMHITFEDFYDIMNSNNL